MYMSAHTTRPVVSLQAARRATAVFTTTRATRRPGEPLSAEGVTSLSWVAPICWNSVNVTARASRAGGMYAARCTLQAVRCTPASALPCTSTKAIASNDRSSVYALAATYYQSTTSRPPAPRPLHPPISPTPISVPCLPPPPLPRLHQLAPSGPAARGD
jgi:hypothetical protein